MRKTTLLSIVAISWCCLLSCTKSSLQDEETSLNDRNEVRFAEPFVYIATKSATDDIPVCWYKTTDVVMPDNFTLTTTLP